MLVFIVWRVFLFKFPTYQPQLIENIASGDWSTVGNLLYRIIFEPLLVGIHTWFLSFRFPVISDFNVPSQAIFWVIFSVGLLFSLLILFFLPQSKNTAISSNIDKDVVFHKSALWIGLAALVLPGIPFWVTNLPIELQFPWDRFTLAFMFGSAILVVWLLNWLTKSQNQQRVVIALFISMAMASHVSNTITYQREWQTQKDFFWQLVWRAPQLEKGTTILTYGLPLQYYSDNSLTAPLNWIYAPENHSLQLPYFLAFTDVRVGASIPELKKDLPIRQRYRNAVFTGNTSDMLVVFYSPPGCLRILDPGRKADLPGMPDEIALALELSDTSRILPSTQTSIPPVTIFGSEPLPEWCYYFEKADFARQNGNWDTIVSLGNIVSETGLTPSNPTELFPFIEGYAHTGKWDTVKSLADDAMKIDHSIQSQLCELINRIENDLVPTTESQEEISDLQNSYQCVPY